MPETLEFWVFWVCFAILLYSYFMYGLLVWLLGFLVKRPMPDAVDLPTATLVVPCYNEAGILPQKVINSLEINYPGLHILFITDGSTDGSEILLKTYPGISVMHQPLRAGKAAAQNRAMQCVSTEIAVFCDANSLLNPDAIMVIANQFRHPDVGGVSGEKRVVAAGTATAGEGFYWRYESHLKKLDSRFYTVVGAAGELFAIRTALYTHMPADTVNDDLTQSLLLNLKGFRITYAPGAVATETASPDLHEEKKRKVRMVAGAWQSMVRQAAVFNVFRHPVLAFQFISHRALRWSLCPLALLLLLPAGCMLAESHWFYTLLWWLQCGFYVSASAGYFAQRLPGWPRPFFVPYYFLFMNYTAILGFFRYLRGGQSALWEKANR